MKKLFSIPLVLAFCLWSGPSHADEGQPAPECVQRNFKEVATVTPYAITFRPKSKRVLYDDIICALKWRKKQCSSIQMSFDGEAIVYDFNTMAEIVVSKATFVQSPEISSPMGSGLAAFADPAAADAFLAAHPAGGKIMTYQDLLQVELP